MGNKQAGLYIKTFGCQMNEYDSEKVAAALSQDYRLVANPEDAELIFVNTCSVRHKAEHKLFSALGELVELKQKNGNLIIGVGGCVAQQEGKQIRKRNIGVDFIVGTHNLSLVPSLVNAFKASKIPQIAVDYREDWETLPDAFLSADSLSLLEEDSCSSEELVSLKSTRDNNSDRSVLEVLQEPETHAHSEDEVLPFPNFSPVRAHVAIQRGCNKNCTYCVVPNTRGPEVSRPLNEILRETRVKAKLGAKELLLLGQTVNSYGLDLTPRVKFSELIKQVSEIAGIERIRFTSPHPQEVRSDFINLFGSIPQLMPHIHLPLQSGSNRILKLMNRNYKKERYLDIIEEIRARVPDIAITTDIIVGFPTETDEDFAETVEMMDKVGYSDSYLFKYSERPYTKALELFSKDQAVLAEVAQERLVILQNLQKRISTHNNQKLVGTQQEVLVESVFYEEIEGELTFKARGRTRHNLLADIEIERGSSSKLGSTGTFATTLEIINKKLPELKKNFTGKILQVKLTKASAHLAKAELR